MNYNKNNFWTKVNNKLQYRNLQAEENIHTEDIFGAYFSGIIDEPVLIYYEIFNTKNSDYFTFIDGCIYQMGDCYIKTGDIILDLGANIGIFARFADEKGAKCIYSFEPIMQNFELLLLNRPDTCEAHRIAVSDQDNQAIQISYKPNSPGGSSMVLYEDGELQTCMGMTISTMIDRGIIQQPDFIKMDIEGAELFAFNGIRDQHLIQARCIAMEIHVGVIGQDETNKIYNRLEKLGFSACTMFNPDQNNIVWFVNQNKI